jgi:hypothetical protein
MTLEPLSSTTAVFLLVDHQTGVFERVVKAPPPDQAEANVLRLARAAALLEIPTILTTSEEKGQNGALLPALEQILPEAYASRIDRHGIIDSLADAAVVEAIEATRTAPARHGRDWHGGVRGWRRRSTLAATATTSPSWRVRCQPIAVRDARRWYGLRRANRPEPTVRSAPRSPVRERVDRGPGGLIVPSDVGEPG